MKGKTEKILYGFSSIFPKYLGKYARKMRARRYETGSEGKFASRWRAKSTNALCAVLPLYYTKKCTFLQVFPRTFCIACINRDFRQSAFQKTVQFANEKGLPCGSPLFQRFCSALSGSVIFRHLSSQIFRQIA